MKVRNLKANHNSSEVSNADKECVKVRNLKANHNYTLEGLHYNNAVLACVKVRNLKANHNVEERTT